jgi:hypothetical protein
LSKKAGVSQSGSEITNSFTILTLLATCGMALIILKKETMSILTIYPHSVLRNWLYIGMKWAWWDKLLSLLFIMGPTRSCPKRNWFSPP